MATKFFLCTTCGNVVVKLVDSGVTPVCCGAEMIELKTNTSEAMTEKHLPIVTRIDDCTYKVTVSSEPHPMVDSHFIRFIFFETENGGQIKFLKSGEKAEAYFCGCKEKPVAVYEYCNLHGLWKSEIDALDKSCGTSKMSEQKCCGLKGKKECR